VPRPRLGIAPDWPLTSKASVAVVILLLEARADGQATLKKSALFDTDSEAESR